MTATPSPITTVKVTPTKQPRNLYPIVSDLSDAEMGGCCCGETIGSFSLTDLALPVTVPRPIGSTNNSLTNTERTTNTMEHQRPSDEADCKPKDHRRWSSDPLVTNKSRPSRHHRRLSSGRFLGSLLRSNSGTTGMNKDDTATDGHPMHESLIREERKFQDIYVLTREIFQNRFSHVWECIHRETGIRYCCKIVDVKTLIRPADHFAVEEEIKHLQCLSGHYNICRLVQVVNERSKIYIVLELATGGNLLSKVVQDGPMKEEVAKELIRCLLYGIHYIHHKKICHLDLEPSNILLMNDGYGSVKIADFGCAVDLQQAPLAAVESVGADQHYAAGAAARRHPFGSVAYTAPEVRCGLPFDTQADMWSVGMIAYFCLAGKIPSDEATTQRPSMLKIPASNLISFPTKLFSHVSRQAKQFVSALVHADPQVRLTAHEALEHPWLSSSKALSPSLRGKSKEKLLRLFSVQTVFRNVMCRKRGGESGEDLHSTSTHSSSGNSLY